MSVFGIILLALIILVLIIALFFEMRSLIKTIREYKKKKSSKNKDKQVDSNKEE